MKTGTKVILIGILFCILETIYFGNHFFPQSKAEKLCDLISAGIVLSGVIINIKL